MTKGSGEGLACHWLWGGQHRETCLRWPANHPHSTEDVSLLEPTKLQAPCRDFSPRQTELCCPTPKLHNPRIPQLWGDRCKGSLVSLSKRLPAFLSQGTFPFLWNLKVLLRDMQGSGRLLTGFVQLVLKAVEWISGIKDHRCRSRLCSTSPGPRFPWFVSSLVLIDSARTGTRKNFKVYLALFLWEYCNPPSLCPERNKWMNEWPTTLPHLVFFPLFSRGTQVRP